MAKKNKPIDRTIVAKPTNRSVIRTERFEGPIPPPDILERYNFVHPGTADRIIRLAEEEQTHRHSIEKQKVDAAILGMKAEISEIRLGQWLGFMIGVVTIITGAIVSIKNQPVSGTLIGTGGVVALVTVFIMGRKKNPHTPQKEAGKKASKPEAQPENKD